MARSTAPLSWEAQTATAPFSSSQRTAPLRYYFPLTVLAAALIPLENYSRVRTEIFMAPQPTFLSLAEAPRLEAGPYSASRRRDNSYGYIRSRVGPAAPNRWSDWSR